MPKIKTADLRPNVFPGEYRFVPAAYYASNAAGIGMYVKYRRSDLKEVRKRSQDARHIWLEMPDREVIIVRMTHTEPFYPSEGDFDHFVNLSLYQEQSARDLGFDYYMTNYVDYLGKEQHSPRNRRVREPGQLSIISDSGGFQFLTGKLDYLDPMGLVNWYNENCDIGIVLDMPIASKLLDMDLQMKMGKLQARNTQLMIDNAAPGLEFMNVVHGSTPESKMKFHDAVVHDDIRRLAVGGGYFDTVMSSIASVLLLHKQLGSHYQHYHFLGITNLFQVIAYMRMAKLGLLPFVTSDSTTYYQKGASKEYLIQTRLTSNISHLNIGQRDNVTSAHSMLPCSCPMCSNLRYTDALSNFGGSAISSATAFHNAYRYNEYLKAMEGLVHLPLTELQSILTKQLGKRASLDEGLKTLAFVDEVAHSSLEKAMQKYSYYLSNTGMKQGSRSAIKSLFGENVAEQDELKDDEGVLKRAKFLLNQYKGPKGEKQSVLKKEKLQGKKILSSKSRKRVVKTKAKSK